MRSRILPIALALTLGALVVMSVLYTRMQKNQSTPDLSATGLMTSPSPGTIQPSPGTPVATASGQPQGVNPMPSNTPDLSVEANGLSKATVTMTTSKGVIKYKFYPKDAPNTVARMIELIGKGFYNNLKFHRVVPNFVIQGGDPLGDGTGGSGQKLRAEFNSRHHVEGTVAMARAADPDSADSQFYFVLSPQPHLDGKYTVFGQVIEGIDVVRRIQAGDVMTTVTVE